MPWAWRDLCAICLCDFVQKNLYLPFEISTTKTPTARSPTTIPEDELSPPPPPPCPRPPVVVRSLIFRALPISFAGDVIDVPAFTCTRTPGTGGPAGELTDMGLKGGDDPPTGVPKGVDVAEDGSKAGSGAHTATVPVKKSSQKSSTTSCHFFFLGVKVLRNVIFVEDFCRPIILCWAVYARTTSDD